MMMTISVTPATPDPPTIHTQIGILREGFSAPSTASASPSAASTTVAAALGLAFAVGLTPLPAARLPPVFTVKESDVSVDESTAAVSVSAAESRDAESASPSGSKPDEPLSEPALEAAPLDGFLTVLAVAATAGLAGVLIDGEVGFAGEPAAVAGDVLGLATAEAAVAAPVDDGLVAAVAGAGDPVAPAGRVTVGLAAAEPVAEGPAAAAGDVVAAPGFAPGPALTPGAVFEEAGARCVGFGAVAAVFTGAVVGLTLVGTDAAGEAAGDAATAGLVGEGVGRVGFAAVPPFEGKILTTGAGSEASSSSGSWLASDSSAET